MIKKLAIALLALGSATAASALTATFAAGAPDPGIPAGSNFIVNFNSAVLPAGATLTGAYTYATGSVKNVYAAPAGDKTQYIYITKKPGNPTALLTTPSLTSVSFYWGSIDKFNSLDILGLGGSVIGSYTGAAWAPSNGNISASTTNGRVRFVTEGDELITGLRFKSTGVAFELDDVAGRLFVPADSNGVPEPATWAMLTIGFGLVGASVRRRDRTKAVAA